MSASGVRACIWLMSADFVRRVGVPVRARVLKYVCACGRVRACGAGPCTSRPAGLCGQVSAHLPERMVRSLQSERLAATLHNVRQNRLQRWRARETGWFGELRGKGIRSGGEVGEG
eukprot:6213472-Pleurochrysis_carterae.AAC.8